MDVVYAATTAQVMLPNGAMVLIQEGEARPTSDPVVQYRPELFSNDAERWTKPLPTSIGPDGSPVEQATAAPGEKRNVRR